MNYTTLGTSSDLRISEISFGCMSLGEDDAANARLLHQALEGGITFFDTADLYQKGQNEQTVGKAFKGMRHKVILATKVGNQWRPDGSGWDWNPRKAYILKAVEESLRRLQTDYIDLYQLHGGTLDDPIDETIDAFEQLKAAGKIRHYGISSIRPNVIREWVKRSNMASVMMQYSLLDRRPEESCLGLLEQHHIGVLARGSYAQGLLLGKPPKEYLGYRPEDVQKAAAALQQLATNSRSSAALAARFSLAPPAVKSAVLGIRTSEQLEAALAITTSPPLSPQEIDQLRHLLPPNQYQQHR
ncbi:aldo/keto reductase [Cesiribacter andamanensis]|uniref:General stress protein 69 n=1 Tax=Cesiribacter andamanensis AMV16 TaxID=1279009 RepID=M7NA55_9BACT|nr:aldo/keto reductase [Cesiribacter andamanensis]EMR04086.1 General stress protein 69 [Cesiribacter andamanensis AMV16]